MSHPQNLRELTLETAPKSEPVAVRNVLHLRRRRDEHVDIGARGRRLFVELRLWRHARSPMLERFYWHFLKPLAAVALILWYTPQYAAVVRRRFSVPIGRQILRQCRLGLRDWVNPRNYYFHEHYRRDGGTNCDAYVMRHEIKEGLLKALHKLRPKVHGSRVNLGHKIHFAEICMQFDLPAPPLLGFFHRGRTILGPDSVLDCDLFVKPEHGRGSIGACAYRQVEPGLYQSAFGPAITTAQLLRRLARRSWIMPKILQPKLLNHPAIADLAEQSLITIRVLTCLDVRNVPVVTHAMLRTISKLEPDWPTREEYAAAIDLATGQLGLMCGDSKLGPDDWYDAHPVTGARVAGRLLPQWPAINALATRAHRVFADRMIVGWDIALTPDGPVLIEGNSYPDTEFLQRVHRQPIGESPLGPLLAVQFDRLETNRGGLAREVGPNAAP